MQAKKKLLLLLLQKDYNMIILSKKFKRFCKHNNTKGISYILLAAFCFSIMSTFVKIILDKHHVVDIMFLRSAIGLAILTFFFKLKIYKINKKFIKFHFLRTALGITAMFLSFTALKYIPLSNITALNFSKIFFIIPLAVFFLKETINFYKILNIFIGFIGVIIIIGFDLSFSSNFIYYFYALLGTFLIALIKILIKRISYSEDNLNIQFWFASFSCIFLIIPYFEVALMPDLKSFLMIILATIFGLLAQYFTISGLRIAKSTLVMPFDFFRVIFSSLIGIIIFYEDITLFFLIGSFIIFSSSLQLSKTK